MTVAVSTMKSVLVIYNSRLVPGYEVDLYENDFEEETVNGFDLKFCLSLGLAVDLN